MRRVVGHAYAERGFTLVELVMTITIMGLVIAPLSMAVVSALNLAPESGARTKAATQIDATLRALSADVGNASKVTTVGRTGKITNYAAGMVMDRGRGTVNCRPTGTTDLFDSRWTDLGGAPPAIATARYYLQWTTPAGSTFTAVELHRAPSTGSDPQVYLQGYCTGTESVATVDVVPPDDDASFNEEVTLTTRLRDTPTSAQDTTVFAAVVRTNA